MRSTHVVRARPLLGGPPYGPKVGTHTTEPGFGGARHALYHPKAWILSRRPLDRHHAQLHHSAADARRPGRYALCLVPGTPDARPAGGPESITGLHAWQHVPAVPDLRLEHRAP